MALGRASAFCRKQDMTSAAIGFSVPTDRERANVGFWKARKTCLRKEKQLEFHRITLHAVPSESREGRRMAGTTNLNGTT